MNENLYSYDIFSGLAAGAYPLIATIYITECVEVHMRGSFGMFVSIMITVGNLFVNGIGNLIGWVRMTGILVAFPGNGSLQCSITMNSHSNYTTSTWNIALQFSWL